jgi:hypothetical protein
MHEQAKRYQRTPLPLSAQTRVGWLALCVFSLIFSPFIGFAIHGKVAEAGLATGLIIATVPLCGLAGLAMSRWLAWRRLPPHLAEEWTLGRLIPTEGGPEVFSPVRFAANKNWIEMLPEGLALSRYNLLRMHGVSDTMQESWIADQTGQLFIAWGEIAEWVIDTDSDGPNFYTLKLRKGGTIQIRRFKPDNTTECQVLDAIRSIGKVPLRLRCDVDCN